MAAIHVDARVKHTPTKHEQRQARHHATHPEHRGEELGKHRTQGHNGTHPGVISHHSGTHVSNPNVHHHNAVQHSEAATALSEKLRKKATLVATARTQAVSSKLGSPYVSGHAYPIKPPVKSPAKVAPSQPTPKAPHPTAPATRPSGAPTAPHATGSSPYTSGHPYPLKPGNGSYISGHPYPTHPFQAPDQSAKPSPHTTAKGPLHPAINIGTYGTSYYRNPQSNVPAEGSASTVSAVNSQGKTPGETNIMQEGHGAWGGFGFDPSRIIPNLVNAWHSIFG